MSNNEESIYIPMSDLLTGFLFVFLLLIIALDVPKSAEISEERERSLVTWDQTSVTTTLRVAVTTTIESVVTVTATVTNRFEFLSAPASSAPDTPKLRRSAKNQETLERILSTLEHNLRENGITVEIDKENGILRLGELVLFDSGQYTLNEAGIRNLRYVATELNKVLRCYTPSNYPCSLHDKGRIETVLIEGHTDSDPYKVAVIRGIEPKINDNWDLSVFRATTTYKLLIATIPAIAGYRNSFDQQVIGVSGYAYTRLVDPVHKPPNRRIDIRIIMETEVAQ